MVKFGTFLALLFSSSWGFDLALDTGHTPSKGGAISASCTNEYLYNRSLTAYISNNLPNLSPNIHLLRADHEEMRFDQRYTLSQKADLFLSIHHDSVQERYIQKNQLGCPSSNHAFGFSIFISRKNAYFIKSLDYAQKFGKALVEQGLTPSLHHAEKIQGENRELLDEKLGIYVFDDLKVLKNAKSPAILFEAGVIVNHVDEATVKRDEYKKKIVKAILHVFE